MNTHPPQKPIAFPLEKHQTFAKPTNLNTFAALREREREREGERDKKKYLRAKIIATSSRSL